MIWDKQADGKQLAPSMDSQGLTANNEHHSPSRTISISIFGVCQNGSDQQLQNLDIFKLLLQVQQTMAAADHVFKVSSVHTYYYYVLPQLWRKEIKLNICLKTHWFICSVRFNVLQRLFKGFFSYTVNEQTSPTHNTRRVTEDVYDAFNFFNYLVASETAKHGIC